MFAIYHSRHDAPLTDYQPFGRIEDITRPQLVPAGVVRSSTIRFKRVRSAVRAQNCLHGFTVSGPGASTRLSIMYEQAIKGHVVRDWLSNHPRIALPIFAFLLGTLTYTVWGFISLVQRC